MVEFLHAEVESPETEAGEGEGCKEREGGEEGWCGWGAKEEGEGRCRRGGRSGRGSFGLGDAEDSEDDGEQGEELHRHSP